MDRDIEYDDAMINMLELIWGEGFMAPGGTGNVDKLVDGLDLEGKRVLDIGCGLGGPACYLAEEYDAKVTGIDIEPQLVDISRNRAQQKNLRAQVHFELVQPGPLPFGDQEFDLVMSSGAFTQTPEKLPLFRECLRVLRAGGALRCYEWTCWDQAASPDMARFIELEELTYDMQTDRQFFALFRDAGFRQVEYQDVSAWYQKRSREELQYMKTDLHQKMLRLLGPASTQHFIKNWESLVVVCEKGELRQTMLRASKP